MADWPGEEEPFSRRVRALVMAITAGPVLYPEIVRGLGRANEEADFLFAIYTEK